MSQSSNCVVSNYLDSLLMDLTLTESELQVSAPPSIKTQDSITNGQRLVPCFDPFLFMDVLHQYSKTQQWLVFILVLRLGSTLPNGVLKKYCLRQCQTLLNNLRL